MERAMKPLTDLDADALNVAREAAETVIGLRAYMPGSMLLVLLGRFRDDIADALEMEPVTPPKLGGSQRALDELTSIELDTLAGSAGTLLDRFLDYMDDPALVDYLRVFRASLDEQKAERAEIRASIGTR
jgi:hypothetical protein